MLNPRWYRMAWWLVVALWTLLLLRPEPALLQQSVVPQEGRYYLAKSVHVAMYAFLCGWGLGLTEARVPRSLRGLRRFWPVAFLSVHGMATEWGQTMVRERTGSVADIGWDHLGIFLGATTWAWLMWRSIARFRSAATVGDFKLPGPPGP